MCVTACHCRRLITLQYRGISLECRVRSPIEEVDLRIAAAIKGAATKDGLLQPLAFEADVVPAAPRAETKELAMMEYRLAKKYAMLSRTYGTVTLISETCVCRAMTGFRSILNISRSHLR